uniref:Putative secreted protein ovary overexpressed n=1 Tax=Rhipicephalus microplus TaxID=6941 RepID=A0A6M2DAU6_RHIMP
MCRALLVITPFFVLLVSIQLPPYALLSGKTARYLLNHQKKREKNYTSCMPVTLISNSSGDISQKCFIVIIGVYINQVAMLRTLHQLSAFHVNPRELAELFLSYLFLC